MEEIYDKSKITANRNLISNLLHKNSIKINAVFFNYKLLNSLFSSAGSRC